MQLGSAVIKLLTSMAGINGKPAWMRQPRTRMRGPYCIRLLNQVEVRNLYAYAVVATVVDMSKIAIVVRMRFKTLSHVTRSIRTWFCPSGIDCHQTGPTPENQLWRLLSRPGDRNARNIYSISRKSWKICQHVCPSANDAKHISHESEVRVICLACWK